MSHANDLLNETQRFFPCTDLSDQDSVSAWSKLIPLTEGQAAWGHIQDRGIDASEVAAQDLVRVVPEDVPVELYGMWQNPRPGDMILQTVGALGFVKGLRRVSVRGGKWTKLAPRKRDPKHEVTAGRVLANATAHAVLSGRTGGVRPSVCVVVEGEPDFLTWSSIAPKFMVFGIVNGCWNLEVAAFVPRGASVLLMTDIDEPPAGLLNVAPDWLGAGERYARTVGRTLTRHRLFRYIGRRSSKTGRMMDQNDLLMSCVLASPEDAKPLVRPYSPPAEDRPIPARVIPTGQRPFGGDESKRRAYWAGFLRDLCADLAQGRYSGDRRGALTEMAKVALAIGDGLIAESEARAALEAAFVNGRPRATASDHRKMINDALKVRK